MSKTKRSPISRVLVIEDDPPIAEGIVRGLRAAGFDVELALNGREGADRALSSSFDMIVLDLMLPQFDGFAAIDLWSGRLSTPVIVVTALTDLDARLRVFGGGAIDYIAKPFWMEELVARIHIRLHHKRSPLTRTTTWEDATLDFDARTVVVAGNPVSLTNHEFNVLAYLVERPDRTITRQLLIQSTLSPDEDLSERTIDSHIARIRRKLGSRAGTRIVTVWGVGYRFEARGAT